MYRRLEDNVGLAVVSWWQESSRCSRTVTHRRCLQTVNNYFVKVTATKHSHRKQRSVDGVVTVRRVIPAQNARRPREHPACRRRPVAGSVGRRRYLTVDHCSYSWLSQSAFSRCSWNTVEHRSPTLTSYTTRPGPTLQWPTHHTTQPMVFCYLFSTDRELVTVGLRILKKLLVVTIIQRSCSRNWTIMNYAPK